MTYGVTLIPGDGVGPELTEATRRVLEATGVPFGQEGDQLMLSQEAAGTGWTPPAFGGTTLAPEVS